MAAIPFISINPDRKPLIHRGDLVQIAGEFWSKRQLEFYRETTLGWSVCPLGYHCFSGMDGLGNKIVFPGIFVKTEDRRKTKIANHQLAFSKDAIERYAKPHFERASDIRAQRDELYRNLTHDLRGISNEIYNQSLIARKLAERKRDGQTFRSLERVLAAQQMMSVRLDIIDYESGQAIKRGRGRIPVFPKLEKVIHCFRRRMSAEKLRYRLVGRSFGETSGPDILEIAFWVVIENAIKYSPKERQINFLIDEGGDWIKVNVQSWGPCIANNERTRIFDRDFRGVAVRDKESRDGSGIGLFACKAIIEGQFRGKISVSQTGDPVFIDGANFYFTDFEIVLPRSADSTESSARMSISQRRRTKSRALNLANSSASS